MNIKSIVGLAVMGTTLIACQSNSFRIDGFARMLHEGDTIVLAADATPDTPMSVTQVHNGKFLFSGETDDIRLFTIYLKQKPKERLTFFLEASRITVELNHAPACSRVSGTVINNEWQALTDSIQQLSRGVMHLLRTPATDSAGQVTYVHAIDSLHRRMSSCILHTAKRNEANALGRYIRDHYQSPEFR